ncbi:MAG: LOG family protein [Actinomycetota bacterium]
MPGTAEAAEQPEGASMVIAVFGSSAGRPGDPGYEEARSLGHLLAGAGYTVATGGYGGTMEACSRGAAAAGGRVIGVTAPAAFPGRSGANAWVEEEVPAGSITERIHLILSMSAACITLDGSIGTLTELMVAWNIAFITGLAGAPAKPVIAVGPSWAALIPELVGAVGTDASMVTLVPDAAAAVAEVRRRVPAEHPSKGSPPGHDSAQDRAES